jgi:hypothetical protein
MKKRKDTNCKIVKAKKSYKCDCCEHTINIGDSYLRINIKNKGIFHFCNNCKDDKEFIDAKINNPEISYDEYEDKITETICWNSCNEQAGY